MLFSRSFSKIIIENELFQQLYMPYGIISIVIKSKVMISNNAFTYRNNYWGDMQSYRRLGYYEQNKVPLFWRTK
jgi:hypothetical protein